MDDKTADARTAAETDGTSSSEVEGESEQGCSHVGLHRAMAVLWIVLAGGADLLEPVSLKWLSLQLFVIVSGLAEEWFGRPRPMWVKSAGRSERYLNVRRNVGVALDVAFLLVTVLAVAAVIVRAATGSLHGLSGGVDPIDIAIAAVPALAYGWSHAGGTYLGIRRVQQSKVVPAST